jgi:hypothetical protein
MMKRVRTKKKKKKKKKRTTSGTRPRPRGPNKPSFVDVPCSYQSTACLSICSCLQRRTRSSRISPVPDIPHPPKSMRALGNHQRQHDSQPLENLHCREIAAAFLGMVSQNAPRMLPECQEGNASGPVDASSQLLSATLLLRTSHLCLPYLMTNASRVEVMAAAPAQVVLQRTGIA